jgi:hypothetical protein
LTPDEAARLAPIVAAQLKAPGALVRKSWRLDGWRIVLVESPQTDPPYLFYIGEPSPATYKGLWAGAARRDEGPEILGWAKKEFAGIPDRLASCFAWVVTKR